jgi:hypothetical protein
MSDGIEEIKYVKETLTRYKSKPPYLSDTVLVAIPRSSSTRILHMLNYIMLKRGITGHSCMIKRTHDGSGIRRATTLIVQRDERYIADKSVRWKGKRVILCIRNPIDVCASEWHLVVNRRKQGPIMHDHSFDGFFRNPKYGFPLGIRWLNDWSEQVDVPEDLLLVKFEEAINPDMEVDQFRKIVDFVGFRGIFSEKTIREVVKAFSFKNLKEADKVLDMPFQEKKRGIQIDRSDPTNYHYRSGKILGYKDFLSQKNIRWAENLVDAHLSAFYHYYKTGGIYGATEGVPAR